ncbi:putative serine/threonine-protein kinase K06H7.1 [Aphelenchoides fujianensis]|nr:putative serine/threonine-protein kinase K06H7.1 [Aphelenchoides fujianensis]
MKAEMKDEELFKNCPKPWIDIVKHLQDLSYESRPNYRLIYDRFVESILERQETFDTPYDWENKDNTKPSESSVVSKRQPPEKKEGVQRKPPTPTTSVDVPQSAMPPSAIPTVDPAHFSSNDIGL